MSQKAKKGDSAATEKMSRPVGASPRPTVESRHGPDTIQRSGKGFSMAELGQAGLSRNKASKWGVRLDLRRRSSSESNVALLKHWAASGSKRTPREGDVKKVKEEIEKVEKEVVAVVKKEGRRAKRGAKKVEKEAVEVIEKPVKSRRKKKEPKE